MDGLLQACVHVGAHLVQVAEMGADADTGLRRRTETRVIWTPGTSMTRSRRMVAAAGRLRAGRMRAVGRCMGSRLRRPGVTARRRSHPPMAATAAEQARVQVFFKGRVASSSASQFRHPMGGRPARTETTS